MNKKFIILTASYGSGNNAAKDGIKNYLQESGNKVLVIDLVKFMNEGGKSSELFYRFSSESIPILWQITFIIINSKIFNILFKYYLVLLYSEKFNKIVYDYKPDYIIGTYPCWQSLVGGYINKFKKTFNFGVFITDATISLQRYFDDKYIDKFFVIDYKTKEILAQKLVNRNNDIVSSFFPIEPRYFFEKNELKNNHICILLSGLKNNFLFTFLSKLNNEDFYKRITIIKGRNEKVYNKLKIKFENKKFIFQDFINIKEELKNIDIFISKPGGALISECIAQSVYFISPFYIAGQEKGNVDLIERNDIGFYSKDINKIIDFLKNKYKHIDINNFNKIKNKDSIKYIIESLF
ncbi:MAG: hypothetical protein PHE25_05200 [Candidatus Gracilibacteria bacterium]|nr:hypothetical protein [Candidatus Gracilibacteria bacterium]